MAEHDKKLEEKVYNIRLWETGTEGVDDFYIAEDESGNTITVNPDNYVKSGYQEELKVDVYSLKRQDSKQEDS